MDLRPALFFEKDEPVGPRMRRTINMAQMRAARFHWYLGKVRSKTVSFPRNQGETCDMITMPMARKRMPCRIGRKRPSTPRIGMPNR